MSSRFKLNDDHDETVEAYLKLLSRNSYGEENPEKPL
jgi:hypothetical protein